MYKKIGRLQKEYLEFLNGAYNVFGEMRGLLKERNADMLSEYRSIIIEFGNVLPSLSNVFGYEQRIQEDMDQIKVFEKYRTNEELIDNAEFCINVLNELEALTDLLLKKYHGTQKVCNCCGNLVYYKPLPGYYELQGKKYGMKQSNPETLNKEEYTCPSCLSSDRDRLMVAFLKLLKLDPLVHSERLLQIAPSKAIEHWIYANCPAVIYESTDFYMKGVTFQSDIQDMAMVEDETYDYFICSHVLEHVQDDRKAMKELYRILKKDGMGLFLVPVSLSQEHIDEEWGLTEAENWRRFGQGDHCRRYAKQELIERLENSGFAVHSLGKDFFGENVFDECGLTDTSVLYVLTKQKVNLEKMILDRKLKRNTEWEEPLVSVILPSYNHEKYVAEAIESVLRQSYHNYEFLIGDDGSEDGTVKEILKYEEQIDQIHLFDANTDGRIVRLLLEETKGKYVAMMHSDDLWAPEKLRMQVLYMENHPECGACFTACGNINEQGEDLGNGFFLTVNQKKEAWFSYLHENGNCLSHPSVLIRRDLYIELVKKNSRRFRQLPDYFMWQLLVQRTEIHVIEKTLTFFRWHTTGDNINTSAPNRENTFQRMVEQTYIRYDMIKNMDGAYFLKAFEDILIKKGKTRWNEKEIMCEKFFVLLKSRSQYLKYAAVHYLYDIYTIEGVPELLENQYGFRRRNIFEITGELLPGIIDELAGK